MQCQLECRTDIRQIVQLFNSHVFQLSEQKGRKGERKKKRKFYCFFLLCWLEHRVRFLSFFSLPRFYYYSQCDAIRYARPQARSANFSFSFRYHCIILLPPSQTSRYPDILDYTNSPRTRKL